ncbi:MFS transporter [Bifidobacterium saguinibicoloris]|uniref:MFS transporter n=1 Tax=Bifidobacterium saguinibicoloris TaxID=2834433 RepID=UPI001C59457E|nr:MFS transporter [Bifidobacterium saguinibicoloris]MBW3079942.1 MFS transporter [Bifidobacterium saguinibicoloris]
MNTITSSSSSTRRPHSLWHLPAYRNWFVADTADVFAVSLRTFAIPLIGLALSGSPFVAGLLVTVESTIGLTLMSIGGALADRHDRRRMMILLGLVGGTLSAAATVLLATGTMGTGLFAITVALFAVMNGLLGPSNDAMLKSLVPMDRFAKAQAIREARESCVELSGGAIGGLLYRVAGWFPFLVSAVLYLIAAVTAVKLPRHAADDTPSSDAAPQVSVAGEPNAVGTCDSNDAELTVTATDPAAGKHGNGHAPGRESGPAPSFLAHFVEGWRWTLTRGTILAAIAQGAVVNVACYGSIVGVQIMLAERGTDAALIGLVGTATGVSALIGSLIAGWLVDHIPTGRLIILTFAVFTAAMLPLLFTDSYGVVVACMAATSLLFPALNAGELGFIFGRTPDDMQGRVSTVFETTIGVPGAFTPALVGWLLGTPGLGFRAVMMLVVGCAAVGLVLACVTPTRRIPRPEHWERMEL